MVQHSWRFFGFEDVVAWLAHGYSPRWLVCCCVALALVACQSAPETPLPTRAVLPSAIAASTQTPLSTTTFTEHPTSTPAATSLPTRDRPPAATPSSTVTVTPARTTTPSRTPSPGATLTQQNTPLPQQFIFGESVEGKPLYGYRYGTGPQTILLVGGIHTGYEANTVRLVEALRAYFAERPQAVEPHATLIFIPLLNADGLDYGRTLRGRFNRNGVDLNRNWGCNWSAEAYFRDQTVYAGAHAFSEPETRDLGSLIQRVRPAAVLFYHAAANGVFAGGCDGRYTISDDLARIYGDAADYRYQEDFTRYITTGTASGWVASQGIPAITVELATADGIEFERNLRGLFAVQAWLRPAP